jgi:IstB-like ATP binding protein
MTARSRGISKLGLSSTPVSQPEVTGGEGAGDGLEVLLGRNAQTRPVLRPGSRRDRSRWPGCCRPQASLARADGSLRGLLARLGRIDVLAIDDWAMAPLSGPERRDFWEICEDRCQVRSMILTSQLPVSRWHEQIGDPTLADGILDRLVHNAHRIEMRGDSMRKNRTKPSQ